MTPHLCLGTAQFGLAYGITNNTGQIPEAEVGPLLKQAIKGGVRWIDTAQAYGNAEEVLGRNLPTTDELRIVSKLPPQQQHEFSSKDAESWERRFCLTLQHLGVSALDTLLLHSSADLLKPGSRYLEDWLLELRTRGLVRRVGVSIYTSDELTGVNPELLNLVQLPLSLYDQRLLQDGTVAKLREKGTAVHARSVYLQGLLLTPTTDWPKWANSEAKSHHQALEALAKQKACRLIDLALGFAREQKDLEAVVLGVCNTRELNDLCKAWNESSQWVDSEWRDWYLRDPLMIDPRQWPR